ncbi:MAG TPA: SCP2 sterol-binding domain-containing protein [Steroidobacteraceae bacterium]|nr:SCP2 sterol-binding domain-containing protein [Steroidobacteraceae bacterium]
MLSETIGNLLNRGLPRSVRARRLIAELAGRSLALEVRGLGRLRLESNGSLLTVTGGGAAAADAELAVGPLGLVALAGEGAQAAVQRGDAAMSGDGEIAAKFQELLTLLRPDPEEELSLVLGDVPAHQLARAARRAAAWGRRAADTAWRSSADFLAHERADLVPRHEGEQFLKGVDALREDLDRLAARIELLSQRRTTATRRSRAP